MLDQNVVCRIVYLSLGGVCLYFEKALPLRCYCSVALYLDEIGMIEAHIAWTEGQRSGRCFGSQTELNLFQTHRLPPGNA